MCSKSRTHCANNEEVRDGSGMRVFAEKPCYVPRFPLYDGAVGTDAKFSQRNSARFLEEYEDYAGRVQEINQRRGGCVYQLTVSELMPSFVQRCLSRAYIGIGCEISDSDLLTALAKHGGEYVRPTRKKQVVQKRQQEKVKPQQKMQQPRKPRRQQQKKVEPQQTRQQQKQQTKLQRQQPQEEELQQKRQQQQQQQQQQHDVRDRFISASGSGLIRTQSGSRDGGAHEGQDTALAEGCESETARKQDNAGWVTLLQREGVVVPTTRGFKTTEALEQHQTQGQDESKNRAVDDKLACSKTQVGEHGELSKRGPVLLDGESADVESENMIALFPVGEITDRECENTESCNAEMRGFHGRWRVWAVI